MITKILKGFVIAVLFIGVGLLLYWLFTHDYNPKPDGFKIEQP
jgi:hypothetical protein